jgi:hypothetical protein
VTCALYQVILMSFSYYLLIAEPLQETEVLRLLLQIADFKAYDVRMPGEEFTVCRAPGVDIDISKRSVNRLKSVYENFGVTAGLIVRFDVSKAVGLHTVGTINTFTAIQLLLLELACDMAWLFNFDECMLRRIDGEITLYNPDFWSPNVEPDLLSRIIFPYHFAEKNFPATP